MSQSSTDTQLINAIVQNLKSRGIFDEFRRECLSDADTKPSFQNLLQRVEGYVSKFLSQQKWNQNINKNQLRERMRTQINESGMLKYGIEHLVEQVVNYKINSLFWPKIETVVKEFLGIQEIPSTPPVSSNHLFHSNDNSVKKLTKSDETIDTKAIKIKEEPIDGKIIEDMCQPMDIETDSNHSTDNRVKEENDNNASVGDSDNVFMDWPTPPQPEMLTPERPELTYSPIESKEVIKSTEDSNSVPAVKREDIKENESFLINKELMNEFKNEKKIKSEVTDPMSSRPKDKEKSNKTDKEDDRSDLSDVSSVHTSDLSDFDDEISLDDSNDEREDQKKKKISLKVVKKITEVLSNEQITDKKSDEKIQKQSPTEEQTNEPNIKSESKRIRKVNPKYSSQEFSSIFTEKERSVQSTSKEESNDSNNESKAVKSESDQRISTRRRRHSNSSDNESKEINEMNVNRSSKISKRVEETVQLDSRSSSRGSIESPLSETTQDSTQSQTKASKRKVSKTRNESQTQRYEASDLYKPRPLISSRRGRPPTTPESSTQPTEDFFIHDLSK